MFHKRIFECPECLRKWEVPYGAGTPCECPGCNCHQVRRSLETIQFDSSVFSGTNFYRNR